MTEKNVGRFTVGKDFDTKALAERALVEITAMGYEATLEKADKGYRIAYQKDIGGLDTALGRWQNSVAEIEKEGSALTVSFHGHKIADKLIAFFLGGFFWGLPWIFEAVALHNRKHSEQVFLNTVSVFVSSTIEDED